MNILILSWRGPGHPNAGGAEISTHEHAKGWVKVGNSVTLFTSYYPGAKKEEIVDGVKIIRSGRQNFGVHFNAFKWYLTRDHPKFDIVIDQFHGIPFFTPLYVKEKKLAFIHEVTKEVWRLNQWPRPLNNIVTLLGNLEPLIFRFYRKVPFITVSKSTKKDLVEWGIPSNLITVIHNGVNVANLRRVPLKEKNSTLIYLGAIAKDKGVEKALEIFSLVCKKLDKCQFWVVGKVSKEYLKQLKRQVKDLRLEQSLIFWGYVNEKKKAELLARAHLLINPSIREGWGLVVIEAATLGTPTIAFNVPGLKDSIRNNKTGILCEEYDVGTFAEQTLSLLADKKKYNTLSKNAIIWSKNFSWKKASNKSLDLIRKIAK